MFACQGTELTHPNGFQSTAGLSASLAHTCLHVATWSNPKKTKQVQTLLHFTCVNQFVWKIAIMGEPGGNRMGIKAHLDFTGVSSGKVKILMYKLRSVKMSMWNEE